MCEVRCARGQLVLTNELVKEVTVRSVFENYLDIYCAAAEGLFAQSICPAHCPVLSDGRRCIAKENPSEAQRLLADAFLSLKEELRKTVPNPGPIL